MSDTIFFRLLDGVNRPSRLSGAVEALHKNGQMDDVHQADPASFRQVPGSPFSYWVGEEMRLKFSELPKFEGKDRTAKQGLATAGDFRFVRAWWESEPGIVAQGHQETIQDKRWVPFAKGGEYSPYYADVHLLVDWKEDGKGIKRHICDSYPYLKGKWKWVAKNPGFYFRPGLLISARTSKPQTLADGCSRE